MAVLGLTSAAPEIKKRACANISPKANPTLMSGYTAKVVANGLKTPREIIFDPKGNLLVIEQGGGGIKLITLTDNGGTDVCQSSAKTLVADRSVRTTFSLRVTLNASILHVRLSLQPPPLQPIYLECHVVMQGPILILP